MAEIKRTATGVKNRVKQDRLSLVAAGVAFYVFLSVFPSLAMVISLYGLFADPQTVQAQVATLSGTVPEAVLSVIRERLTSLAQSQDSSLTIGFLVGLVVSLWSANKAMKAVAESLNLAYDAEENRGIIKVNLVTLLLTLMSSIGFILAVSTVVVVPILVGVFLTQQSAAVAATVLSWMVFVALLVGMFLVLYRFATSPQRRQSWGRLVPGALFAAALFVVASAAFSLYVANFGNYNKQYGALGAVVIMMLWLFIGSYIFLLGAELNAERSQPAQARQRLTPAHAH